ncbi:hypothetical protein U1Q18_010546 [Sarracenia purpurea var. burkii]
MMTTTTRTTVLVLLLVTILIRFGRSRVIGEDLTLVSDGAECTTSRSRSAIVDELNLGATTKVTCEPIYGFLPCATELWGQLFLVVVYEFLLSLGDKYVTAGSDLFFSIIGPGIFGASLFHILGTIPVIVLMLVSGLSGSTESAQEQAAMGMSLLAGSSVMLLTLIWGSCVALGSTDFSNASASPDLQNHKSFSFTGSLFPFS